MNTTMRVPNLESLEKTGGSALDLPLKRPAIWSRGMPVLSFVVRHAVCAFAPLRLCVFAFQWRSALNAKTLRR